MPPIKTIEQHQYQRKIYSVSELNRACKQTLESQISTIWLEAEISNLAMPASGHWYFSLKDSRAQVRCAMFKGANRSCKVPPEEGMKVLIRAKVSLFEPRGEFQLIVEYLEPSGAGELLRQFEELKAKLKYEGLFDDAHKKTISQSYESIGVITSSTGAAIHDVISVIRRRYPLQKLIVYPCMVQGNQAASQIIQQINVANERQEVDLLLLVRGGGSIEDLWCFNDETLARAIFESELPIVTGVGHEVDFTIADYVADLRAPTPSAAAERTTFDQQEILAQLEGFKDWLINTISYKIDNYSQQVDWLKRQISSPELIIKQNREKLSFLKHRASSAVNNTLSIDNQHLTQIHSRLLQQNPSNKINLAKERRNNLKQKLVLLINKKLIQQVERLAAASAQLHAVSPLATLSRGYSITRNAQGDLIKDASQLKTGDVLITSLDEGSVRSEVIETHNDNMINEALNSK